MMYEIQKSKFVTQTEIVYEIMQYVKLYYDIPPLTKIKTLILGDRINYIVDNEINGIRLVLRIGLPFYTQNDILSELAWIDEIRNNTDIVVPEPVRGLNGEFIQTIILPNVGKQYKCVLFSYLCGTVLGECEEYKIQKKFKILGEITAKLHQNSILYDGSKRQLELTWDFASLLGENARFGLWYNAPEITEEMDQLFTKTSDIIKQRLERFGKSSSRFGLINANMSLHNIINVQNKMSVINFEGCGLGWFLYDFATAVNSVNTNVEIPKLFSSWCEGYKKYRKLHRMETEEMFTLP